MPVPSLRGGCEMTRSRENTRARLLEAAHEVFAEVGLDAASVEAICERAGFTRGAFYSNFESKDELFLALITRLSEDKLDEVSVRVRRLSGTDSPLDLVRQTVGRHHQYPDGFMLYLGTLFAPVEDRDVQGEGFTHKVGDIVSISSPALGTLMNIVRLSTECPPWTFGAGALMRNLAGRGLI